MIEGDPVHRQELAAAGFTVLPPLAEQQQQSELRETVERLFAAEGQAAGSEFRQEAGARRLANLINKGEIFRQLVAHATVLSYVRDVLGDEFKLSSANARSANPHTPSPQPLHCDMGAVPDERGYWVCNVVWMIDEFTADNGALRAVPGSHCWRSLPQDQLADPLLPHPDEVLVTGPPGSVVVMNAHLWHGGTGNRTDRDRAAFHAFYCRSDKPQQQYQKGLLDPELQAGLDAELRGLLALDDPLNDELSRDDRPRSGFLK